MDRTAEDRVRKIAAEVIGMLVTEADAMTRESKFVDDMGADSLDRVELIMWIEDEFGIDIPDDEAEAAVITFGTLCDYVAKRTVPKAVAG